MHYYELSLQCTSDVPGYLVDLNTMNLSGVIKGDLATFSQNLAIPMRECGFDQPGTAPFSMYRLAVMCFIFEILQDKKVRDYLIEIASILIHKKVLRKDEIAEIASSSGFDQYIKENKEKWDANYKILFSRK